MCSLWLPQRCNPCPRPDPWQNKPCTPKGGGEAPFGTPGSAPHSRPVPQTCSLSWLRSTRRLVSGRHQCHCAKCQLRVAQPGQSARNAVSWHGLRAGTARREQQSHFSPSPAGMLFLGRRRGRQDGHAWMGTGSLKTCLKTRHFSALCFSKIRR